MIESAAKVVEADFDRLNTFVINARYNEPTVPIANSDLGAKWWKTWTVDTRGPFLLIFSFLPRY